MDFISDRELGTKAPVSETIGSLVYNGLLVICSRFYPNLSQQYPLFCPDDGRSVYDPDINAFFKYAQAEIPDFIFRDFSYCLDVGQNSKYALLDFLGFFNQQISDFHKYYYHKFFNHDHLSFPGTFVCREEFRNAVNEIFERNGLVFEMDDQGSIVRKILKENEEELLSVPKTADDLINTKISEAARCVLSPKAEDRQEALEKLWDAFERLKTLSGGKDKRASVEDLCKKSANGLAGFDEILNKEAFELTNIGNNYQIRHFEKGKPSIPDPLIVDYLFFRLLALILLFEKRLS